MMNDDDVPCHHDDDDDDDDDNNVFHYFRLCHWNWWDRKDQSSMHLIELQLMVAMGPPGGGRNDLTPRFIRHFNVITMNEFSDDAMLRIFSTIMEWHIKTQVGNLDSVMLLWLHRI